MKRCFVIIFLILSGFFCIYGQNSTSIDLILALDTSSGMSSSYQTVSDYVTGAFLSEFLRIGDTFHLIPFSSKPRLDSARRVEGRGDVETIIGRMLLQYPLENGNDIGAAIRFAEEYASSLPSRPKKIVLISAGGPDANNLVSAAKQRLYPTATLDFVLVTPGQPLTNLPQSGRSPSPAQAAASAPQPPAVAVAPADSPQPTATPSAAPPPSASAADPQPLVAASPATASPVPSTPATATPSTSPEPPAAAATTPATPPPATTPAATSEPSASPAAAQPTVTVPTAAETSPAASQTLAPDDAVSSTPQASDASAEVPKAGDSTAPVQQGASGTAVEPSKEKDVSPEPKPAASEKPVASRESVAFPLPLIIALAAAALLILGIILFFATRKLRSGPNRVIAKAASPKPSYKAEVKEKAKYAGHGEDIAKYAAVQNKQRTTPYANRPVRVESSRTAINPSGPLLLNLFVEDQNTAIGKRNIHSLKPGYSLSVGGGKSDFLIFLVPVASNIGEIRRDAGLCTFIPRKPKYFPDLGSSELRDCINKTIRVVSDRNYEVRFRFEQYEDPLHELNRLFNSLRVPG
jgi:hypothetical protein